jgi:signal transduction histidine kinase
VRGDRARLEQVVLILLENAVKYNRAGGRVAVAVRRRNLQAALEVSDTGCGIDPDELPQLGARFHRGRQAGRSAEGSGLGLAIAQGIVRAHGGHIAIASSAGSGTCVSVTLPLAAAREATGLRGRD